MCKVKSDDLTNKSFFFCKRNPETKDSLSDGPEGVHVKKHNMLRKIKRTIIGIQYKNKGFISKTLSNIFLCSIFIYFYFFFVQRKNIVN